MKMSNLTHETAFLGQNGSKCVKSAAARPFTLNIDRV